MLNFLRKSEKFKEIVLHVGFHKTGTTSFQVSCAKNKKILGKISLHYPVFHDVFKKKSNHGDPIHGLYFVNKDPDRTKFKGRLPSERANSGYRRQLERALAARCDKLLLSGERISHLPPDGLQSLKLHLAQYTHKLRVVAMVRNPLEFLEGAAQEIVKAGNAMTFAHLAGKTKRKIIKLCRVFEDDVEFLNFHDAIDDEFGPSGYLLSHIGVDRADLCSMTFAVQNVRMSAEAVRLLAFVNSQNKPEPGRSTASKDHRQNTSALRDLPGGEFRLYRNEFDTIKSELLEETDWLNRTLGFGFVVRESMRLDLADEWAPQTLEKLGGILANGKRRQTNDLVARFLRQEADRLLPIDRGKALRLRCLADAHAPLA